MHDEWSRAIVGHACTVRVYESKFLGSSQLEGALDIHKTGDHNHRRLPLTFLSVISSNDRNPTRNSRFLPDLFDSALSWH